MARPASTAEAVEGLEAQLGYQFRDRGLLSQALTHRSHRGHEGEEMPLDNERLEFLRRVGLSVSQFLEFFRYFFKLLLGGSGGAAADLKAPIESCFCFRPFFLPHMSKTQAEKIHGIGFNPIEGRGLLQFFLGAGVVLPAPRKNCGGSG